MESNKNWVGELFSTWSDKLQSAVVHVPGLLGAFAILVLGYLLARLVRRTTRTMAEALNQFTSRQLSASPMAAVRLSPSMISLLAEVFFWVVLVIAATFALRVGGFRMIAQWLDYIAVYIPNFVAALVILLAGFLLSIFVREKLAPQGEGLGVQRPWVWLAPTAQVMIIVLALLVTLDQMGIEVGLLIALAVVAAAGVALTLGGTIALGARQYTANLIGIRSVRTQLSVGEWLRVAEIEGEVLEFSSTQIVLDTEQGRVLLPGHFLDAQPATILYRDTKEVSDHG